MKLKDIGTLSIQDMMIFDLCLNVCIPLRETGEFPQAPEGCTIHSFDALYINCNEFHMNFSVGSLIWYTDAMGNEFGDSSRFRKIRPDESEKEYLKRIIVKSLMEELS